MGSANGRKFMEKKNKVEEFHLTNLASLGTLESNEIGPGVLEKVCMLQENQRHKESAIETV